MLDDCRDAGGQWCLNYLGGKRTRFGGLEGREDRLRHGRRHYVDDSERVVYKARAVGSVVTALVRRAESGGVEERAVKGSPVVREDDGSISGGDTQRRQP